MDVYLAYPRPGHDRLPLADLADVSDRWQRYSYRGAKVLLDRLDGRIAELVHAQATLTPTEADTLVREQLDGYLNFIYRAAKNRRDKPREPRHKAGRDRGSSLFPVLGTFRRECGQGG